MKNNSKTIHERDVVLWVNVVLFGMACLLFFYYIVIANSIASKNYKIQVLQKKAESLAEINSSLMSKKLVLETPASLLEFARSQKLVEARNISYIFEGKNVAQR